MKPAHSRRREVILYFAFGIGTTVLAFLTYLAVFGIAEHWLHISMEDKTRVEKTMGEHRQIYDAIMSGNAELAMELTTKHIENAKKHMIGSVE